MNTIEKDPIRWKIVNDFAKWTALSSARSGRHAKSGEIIYPIFNEKFDQIFNINCKISEDEFDEWHREKILSIKELCPGWAAKIVNVYLKTLVYIGGFGRNGLVECIHPPIDGDLWKGIKRKYGKDKIMEKINHKTTIKSIETYEDYNEILKGMKYIAKKEECLLIEVEKFWEGVKIK